MGGREAGALLQPVNPSGLAAGWVQGVMRSWWAGDLQRGEFMLILTQISTVIVTELFCGLGTCGALYL